jgi:glucan phosphorylase
VTRKAEIKGREAEFIGGPGDFKVLDFLIDKIVEQSVSPGALTLAQYEANILETIKDKDLVIRLQSVVNAITDLNSFYKILYRTIEELKEIKMSKTDSSSIIDIFLRRLAAYFQKLSFKEIISLYQLFMAFKLGK